MLEKITSPADIKSLSDGELDTLAREIREKIISTVSENGGHLASNLGTVELTLALHREFDCPKDHFIFDVGHQAYAHKLLTGRYGDFGSLRETGGISGFTNRGESGYDTVTAGHSGSSVSVGLGLALAESMKGSDAVTVSVVGDGSFTNGMISEALNNCPKDGVKFIIILNDNGMSISENVGGFSDHFARIRTSEHYFSFKCFMKEHFVKVPLVGKPIVKLARLIKNAVKRLIISGNIFETFGLEYLGPVDGNNIAKLTTVLREAKSRDEVTVVHVRTKKGLGYAPAEAAPEKYHSTAPFDIGTGERAPEKMSFTAEVSDVLCEAAEENEKICAVCAAMRDGTGLDGFAELFPDRFFDTGIAEEHAVAFCGGLSLAGYHPVCALYSTFAQRVYDQLFHDVVLQKTPLTLLLSHAGLVAGDGVTHQGIFDVALFSSVPDVRIFSPDSYSELSMLLKASLSSPYVDVIRYPKGEEAHYDRSVFTQNGDVSYNVPEGAEAVIVTYGRMTSVAVGASEKSAHRVGVVRVSRLMPIPLDEILAAVGDVPFVYILEEGIRRGGFAERLAAHLHDRGNRAKTLIHAVNGEFPPHGSLAHLFERYGFTPEAVAGRLDAALNKGEEQMSEEVKALPQLIMRWKNDHAEKPEPTLPDGCEVLTFPEVRNAVDEWLDIVQYGLSNGRETKAYYDQIMTGWPHYSDDKCFFVKYRGEYVATVTVICDYENKDGYVHMVACRESARGLGIGNWMSSWADYVLRREGMETAHLTTDDWRIPAIKTYLKNGFEPDLVSREGFGERWGKIFEIING